MRSPSAVPSFTYSRPASAEGTPARLLAHGPSMQHLLVVEHTPGAHACVDHELHGLSRRWLPAHSPPAACFSLTTAGLSHDDILTQCWLFRPLSISTAANGAGPPKVGR